MPLLGLVPLISRLGILLLAPGFGTPSEVPRVWVEREVHTMGTALLVRVKARDPIAATAAAERAIGAVEQVEAQLSTWRDGTPLALLNAAPLGAAVPLEPGILALLLEMRTLSDATAHAFDPTVGALIDIWDLRGIGRQPGVDELDRALAAVGWRHFVFDTATAVRQHPAAWIDTGGFGKGAALRAARDTLVAAGVDVAFLNFGGQVLALGGEPDAPWEVAIADPATRSHVIARIALSTGSAATTAQSERQVVVDGSAVGHVVDPRSGQPVAPWGGVTVVDRDPLRADVLSTALFVLGPEVGWQWAERHRVAALFIERTIDTTTIRATSALAGVMVREGM